MKPRNTTKRYGIMNKMQKEDEEDDEVDEK